MNQQLIQSFMNKIKQESINLEREITGSTVNTKDAIVKIKEMENNLTDLYNLLRIEESSNKTTKSKCNFVIYNHPLV